MLVEDSSSLNKVDATYSYEIDTKQSKYESKEHSHSVTLTSPDSPWSLKFESTLRKNKVDKDASRYFLQHESLPSSKQSMALSYFAIRDMTMTRVSAELALPLL
jgi:hypothetical protein